MAGALRAGHGVAPSCIRASHTSQIDVVLDKGQGREDDGYSGFERTELERLLREREVDTVHVTGLALDYCVRATALDARRAGFEGRAAPPRPRARSATRRRRWRSCARPGWRSSTRPARRLRLFDALAEHDLPSRVR